MTADGPRAGRGGMLGLCACENELDAGGKAALRRLPSAEDGGLLPSSVTLPDDISPLVQKTYIDMPDGAFETDELAREWKAYKEKAKRKERDADAFKVLRRREALTAPYTAGSATISATATHELPLRCATGSLPLKCCSW